MEVTYEMLQPILLKEELKGSKMFCEFGLEDERISSSAAIGRDNTTKGRITNIVTTGLFQYARREVTRLLRNILGTGAIGHAGRQIAQTIVTTDTRRPDITTKEHKQAAVVEAFESVADRFFYDPNTNEWNWVEDLTAFEQHLNKYPITEKYDREILARMLVEIAQGDDGITGEEEYFIYNYLNSEIASLDDFKLKDKLSKTECAEVSNNVKGSLFLLAAAAAMVDHDISQVEKEILSEFGNNLGLGNNEAQELYKSAKLFILEKALVGGTFSKSILADLAQKLEIDLEEAERVEIKLRKK